MKRIFETLSIIAILAVAAMFLYNKFTKQDAVTKIEFREAHAILNQKIDSLKQTVNRIDGKIDTIKIDVKTINTNIDTLKSGQIIIFQSMQENKNKSFWDYLK